MRNLFLMILTLAMLALIPVSAFAHPGLISVKSSYSVKETGDRLVSILKKKGMTVFTRINHAAGAIKAGMSLPDTELVIFGNPKIGTPLMKCNRTTAIDLPQKALIWKDKNGQVWLTYNDPKYLQSRHQIKACAKIIKKVQGALRKFAGAATK